MLALVGASRAQTPPFVLNSAKLTNAVEYAKGIEGPAVGLNGDLFVQGFKPERGSSLAAIGRLPAGKTKSEHFATLPQGSATSGARVGKDGRLVMIAVQGGSKAEVDLWTIIQKRLVLTGSTLRPRTTTEKAAIAAELPMNGSLFVGTEGRIAIAHDGFPTLLPEERFQGFVPPAPSLPDSPGHHAQWIAACT